MNARDRTSLTTIVMIVICGALLPLLLPGYLLTSVITALCFVILAQAVGALYTYLRLLMFGVGGFYAIGAYVVMLGVGQHGMPLGVGFLVAILLPGLVALILAPLIFRLRGLHFALVTFAVAELLRSVIVSWQSLTGGWSGITLNYDASPIWFISDSRQAIYWIALAGVVVTTTGFLWFRHSPAGLRAIAIGDDLSMARALCVSPRRFQYMLFTASGMLCGFAGAITALSLRFVDPSVFSATHALAAVTVLIIGGWRVVCGPMLGAMLVIFLPDMLEVGPLLAAWIYGGSLIVAIKLFPEGIGGTLLDRLSARRRAGIARPPAAAPLPSPVHAAGLQDAAGPGGRSKLLDVKDMTIRFGGLTAVKDISLQLRPGEILGIIGPNGAGKTTLLNGISGFTPTVTGTVHVDGVDVGSLSPDQRAEHGLVRSFQATRVFDTLSVREHVLLVPGVALADPATQRILVMLRLTPYLEQRPKDLPYGTRRSLGLALTLLMRPRYLLVDEPSSGLSAAESDEIARVLEAAATQDVGICVIDHDMRFMRRLAKRMLVLNSGELVASGATSEVLAMDDVRRIYLGGVAA